MKKTTNVKKWMFGILFGVLVLAIEFFLIAPFFMRDKKITGINANEDSPASACSRVVSVLENQLKKIGEDGEAADYLERAKILNRLSIETCDEEARRKYFGRALSELSVADALRMLNTPLNDVNQKIGFYWKERAEFFRMHQMSDRELEIYDKYLSIPGRSRDVYSLVKKAEIFVRVGRLNDAVLVYSNIADICRAANNSNCYVAGAQFADLLEENIENQEIVSGLRQRWSKESDLRELFRYNGDASARIRKILK
ncbi:MAG: hypothetical protein LBD94_00960 [Rickettsiales bacterium]|jgi:hypothetical protein|nr:hypothetical protein [Rickettsiales bacterium]